MLASIFHPFLFGKTAYKTWAVFFFELTCIFEINMQDTAFYKTARWEAKRKAILKRDGYEDQILKRYGKHVPAETVHHIFPVEDYPEFKWSTWNLISVSKDTHNKLHDRATGSLSDEGMALLKRTARKYNLEI
jgi:hypothetical protein